MGRKYAGVCYSFVLVILLLSVFSMSFGLMAGEVNALDTENFYFDSFEADYYLSRDGEGLSHLKVDEVFTVVFPDYNQNKGFCRDIPFSNQDGKNITLTNLSANNLSLTRNGEPEPIYSIDKYDDYFEVCTGDENYVLGTQIYEFKYAFSNVITEFNEKGDDFQELYWDTNGTGWAQKFEKVTARLHFDEDIVNDYDDVSHCYIGKYSENLKDRCNISKISDGVEFSAKDIRPYENLTFAVRIKKDTFNVPEIQKNYLILGFLGLIGAVCLLFVAKSIRKYLKIKEKVNYYKSLFVKPEYQPSSEFSLAEMAELYYGKKKDVKVAMLLDLIVRKKIELIKSETSKCSRKWEIGVKNLDGVRGEEISLLTILNNGKDVAVGDNIKIESHIATSELIKVRKGMEDKILGDLKKDGLVEDSYKLGESAKQGISNSIAMVVVFAPVLLMCVMMFYVVVGGMLGLGNFVGEIVLENEFAPISFIMIAATVILCTFISGKTTKYAGHTTKGLDASRYMDGLRLYMEMAEVDRIKMLQSIKGADTSPEGVVKLYEKLLPYAAVFGLEESWMDEMKQYCEIQEIEEPDYLMAGLAASEISRIARNASSYAVSSTTMSSGSGGSSSSFSGSSGGGFSGGGGGGGGGHGR